jgi:hypothetical protein
MVMRNRHDGTNTPEWWDDLPPAVKQRISPARRTFDDEPASPAPHASMEAVARRLGHLRYLTLLAMMFLAVALATLLFILIALSYVVSVPPPAR